MIVIGLTGGIGSGKSTVANIFSELGVPVIDTDIIAREVVEPNQPAYQAIVEQFGSSILTQTQTLDRANLRKRILNNDDDRLTLEGILHPIILETVKTRLKQFNNQYCIVVIPLLIENNRYTMIDRTLVIDTSIEKQLERASQRDSVSKSDIERLIAIQANRDERLAAADDVILNEQDMHTLRTATLAMHDKYMNL